MTIHGQIDKVAPLETGHYPALGFDPAPGAVARVSEVATNLGTVARELGEAYSDISQIGRSGGIWEGEAAEAFQGQVGELPTTSTKRIARCRAPLPRSVTGRQI